MTVADRRLAKWSEGEPRGEVLSRSQSTTRRLAEEGREQIREAVGWCEHRAPATDAGQRLQGETLVTLVGGGEEVQKKAEEGGTACEAVDGGEGRTLRGGRGVGARVRDLARLRGREEGGPR